MHGFSRDLFRPRESNNVFAHAATALLDNFTVMPTPRERPLRVNVNTASREVLLAVLGIDQGYAAQEVIERYLDVRSLFFRIEAEAVADGQSTSIRAIAQRGENSAMNIVQWLF